ncbi:MAG: hypothetical protein A2014_08870 [Spirochaetes bacterium GWF1_49_6]|nr:MAG: hypothetical protein A2014_08870 [Spirochaetes bacterium GWF1_49_6]
MARTLILTLLALTLASCAAEPVPPKDNTPSHPTNALWMVLVYLDGDNNLEADALKDFNEIEAASALTNTNIIVLVLFDRVYGYSIADGDWTGTRLYQAVYQNDTPDNTIVSLRLSGMGLSAAGDSDELNMGDPGTLARFVDWANANYNTQYTFLVLWNHGDGWEWNTNLNTLGVAYDDTSGDDFIGNNQFAPALAGKGIDVIGFDACLMGMLETAYDLKDAADYMVASADLEPNGGWKYDDWLDRFDQNPTPSNLCYSLVMSYSNTWKDLQYTTLAAYDLRQVTNVFAKFEAYVSDLIAATNLWINPTHTNIPTAMITTLTGTVEQYYYQAYGGYIHLDLYDLAQNYPLPSSTDLMSAIDSMVMAHYQNPLGDIFAGNPRSHGIALYLGTFYQIRSPYGKLHLYDDLDYTYGGVGNFLSGSLWDDYLRALYVFPHFMWIGAGTTNKSLALHTYDYYQILVTNTGTLSLTLDVPPSCDDSLFLYHGDIFSANRVGSSEAIGYGVDETIIIDATNTGWYMIEVLRYAGTNVSEEYQLNISGSAGIY